MKKISNICFFLILLFAMAPALNAQTKRPKKVVKKTAPVVAATPQPTPEPVAEKAPAKTNERPAGDTNNAKPNSRDNNSNAATVPVYFYEFTRPGFTYSRVLIEHDEAGKGKISFQKGSFDEAITDPIDLSAVTLAKIKDALTALNFVESTENYQHARDFSHLGNVSITVKRGERSRTAKYNWTDKREAKFLMDEYRRISNEYTWRFEIITARENYPLQTPGMMDALDSYLKRDEISDPPHLLPFLTQLSTDERLPLMARNHAAKIIKQIEKAKK